MRNTLLFLALMISSLLSQAQITLETTYPVSLLSVVKLQYSGYKYATVDTSQFTLYNMNHSVFKHIPIPQYTLWSEISYVTETLFDTDSSNIEYLVRQPTLGTSAQDYTVKVYNEDGTLLFWRDSTDFAIGVGGLNHPLFGSSPIVNTDNGTKLFLHSRYTNDTLGSSILIYDLPGALECSACSNPLISGMSNVPPDAGFFSAAPNPANNSTRINYRLPDDAKQGTIALYNIQGNELKRYEVDKTFNYLQIPVADFAPGTYFYSLQVEGRNTSGKKMIVIH